MPAVTVGPARGSAGRAQGISARQQHASAVATMRCGARRNPPEERALDDVTTRFHPWRARQAAHSPPCPVPMAATARESVAAEGDATPDDLGALGRSLWSLYTFRLGRKPVVVVAEPALIQTVLRHRPETYRRLHTIAAAFDDLGEQGVFTAEGAHWRRQRRVVMPALSAPQVRQFFPTLTAVTTCLQTRWARAAARARWSISPPN